jgi:16S rRNA (adenine1518-N6/adenine1519-N6)-dimethyltransferase
VTSPSPRHRPRKRFAQHFLAPAWARRVVSAIERQPGDVFLEIGPGQGALTLPLAATGSPVLAVEIDRDLIAGLVPRVPPNVTLVSGDALAIDVIPFLTGLEPQRPADRPLGPAPARRFRVVGNLPYNLTTPILFRLIEWHRRHALFADATLMVQREVADRLTARAGTREYGVLGISAQVHTQITRLLDLPPGAFSPAPKVRSSVVRLTFGPPTVRLSDEALFDELLRALFSQRRKTLTNALKRFDPRAPAALTTLGLDGRRRPETLQLEEIAGLVAAIAAGRRPPVL